MHCLLSTCHFLLILIPPEEPPHLTADLLTYMYLAELRAHAQARDTLY